MRDDPRPSPLPQGGDPPTSALVREDGNDLARLPEVRQAVWAVLEELIHHPGHASCSIVMRWQRRGIKEILVQAGREHRFLVRQGEPEGATERAVRR
jgi:hypothetical protein